MADDALTVVIADTSTKTLRTRDVAGGDVHAQKVDVGPWVPTVASSADNQYNLTVSTSVVTLTVPSGYTHALITVDGAAVRFTEDSSSPSGSSGMYLADGFIGELALPNPLKFFRDASTDASLNVSYRKYV